MKLHHPALLWLAGSAGAGFIRSWMHTLRVKIYLDEAAPFPQLIRHGHIYCFWHETMLLPAFLFANCGARILISKSKDGDYIARIVQKLGFQVVRGSSSRGGLSAFWDLAQSVGDANIGITPDGPRGPRQVLQEGAIYLAARTKKPIVPVGFAFQDPWRAGSWDRLILPKPFTRAVCYFGAPIRVLPGFDSISMTRSRRLVGDGMALAMEQADRRLAGLPAKEAAKLLRYRSAA